VVRIVDGDDGDDARRAHDVQQAHIVAHSVLSLKWY
jgi:hypothetical protein